jgi:hypothetical protein
MNKNYLYIGGAAVVIVAAAGVWFLFPKTQTPSPANEGTQFSGGNQSVGVTTNTSPATNQPFTAGQSGGNSSQIIFKIDNGPVATAALLQTTRPTTTIARYIMQENAHVFDLVLDSPGAVARSVSNTTVPSIAEGLWTADGQTALLQYVDGSTIKTLALVFAPSTATSTSRTGAKMRFLPDNIAGAAFSPDSKQVAYLLSTSVGADGYTAAADGAGAKKLFSLPLSQLVLSWPAQGTLLLYTKSAAGVPGVMFSIDSKTGSTVPLLYAPGLTATANHAFSSLLYQTSDGESLISYSREIKTGLGKTLLFSPSPEKCVWSAVVPTAIYCATSLLTLAGDYLDQWHLGAGVSVDSIVGYNLSTQRLAVIATPGGKDGGVDSDILSLAVSPGDKYLLFIKKDDRSLWGVRLGN